MSVEADPACGRGEEAGADVEECRLAGAVAADDAEDLVGGDREGSVVRGP